MTDSHRVLVVGSSGKFVHHLVPLLRQRQVRVRGMIHAAHEAARVKKLGAEQTVVADLTDSASLRAALEGIDRAFYIAPAFMPNEAEAGQRFVEIAREQGVKRIVFSSVIHPVLGALINHAAKAPVEEAILDSGMEYTLLHPALFFQDFEATWPSVLESGVLAEPWSCDTRFSRVDYREVLEVAARALTEDSLLYGTFELAAEGWWNRWDVARLVSEALGREVLAERRDPAELDVPPAMQRMFAHYDRHGLRGSAVTLRAILNREPRTLAAYLRELAARNHHD